MQYALDLIPHTVGREIIQQRANDGYINATAMCKAAGKLWGHYRANKTTDEFLDALSASIGIPIDDMLQGLIQSKSGSPENGGGTWVHPQVAVHLAQWLSADFAVKVSGWVYDWMNGAAKPQPAVLPYHLRRFIANHQNVPVGHFSVLTELTQILIGPLEMNGYTIPEDLMPDISSGRMFCKWLRDKHGIDTDTLPTYMHEFEDGRQVKAKAYPETLLAQFRQHFRDEWLPSKAVEYFSERDPAALAFLPKLLPTRH